MSGQEFSRIARRRRRGTRLARVQFRCQRGQRCIPRAQDCSHPRARRPQRRVQRWVQAVQSVVRTRRTRLHLWRTTWPPALPVRSRPRPRIEFGRGWTKGSIRAEQWIVSARGIATTFIGGRVINHSKHVLEDTYDLWDHFELLHVIRTPAERAMGLPSLVAATVVQTSHHGGKNKKAPRAGPSSCTIVQREPISSSGCRQLPILRQYHRIDGVNDSVRRDQIRFHDTGCVDAHVR